MARHGRGIVFRPGLAGPRPVAAGDATTISPPTGTLSVSGPTLSLLSTVAIGVGALTFASAAPSLGQPVVIPAASLTVSGPVVTLARMVPLTGASLTATGQTALLSANSNALRFYGEGNSSTDDKVYIVCNPSDAINVGQTDFTIEFWCRMPTDLQAGTATAGANYSWINSPILVDRDLIGSVGSGGDWGISATDGRITFGLENSAASQRTIIGTTDLRDDRRHHVAVTRVRSSGDMAVYVDGVREALFSSGPSGDVHLASDSATDTWNRYLALGGEKHALDWPQGQWRGWLDELRLSTSLRYTGTSYTIPSADFTPDANAVGLYHFNEGTGTTLLDFSGSANHGDINVRGSGSFGPTWQTDGWQEWPGAGYTPAPATLTLTGLTLTIARALPAPTGALVVTGVAPSVVRGLPVPSGALTLTGEYVAVAVPGPSTAALTLTGQAPTLVGSGGVVPGTAALVLTGQVPTLSGTAAISVPTGSLVVSGQGVTLDRGLGLIAGSLVLTGGALSLTGTARVDQLTGALVVTGLAPSISGTGAISLPVGSLVLTGLTPVRLEDSQRRPDAGALTLTGTTARLPLSVGVPIGALTLSGQPLELVGTGAIVIPSAGLIWQGTVVSYTAEGGSPILRPASGTLTLSGGVLTFTIDSGTPSRAGRVRTVALSTVRAVRVAVRS